MSDYFLGADDFTNVVGDADKRIAEFLRGEIDYAELIDFIGVGNKKLAELSGAAGIVQPRVLDGILGNLEGSIESGMASMFTNVGGGAADRTKQWLKGVLDRAVEKETIPPDVRDFILDFTKDAGFMGAMYGVVMIVTFMAQSFKAHFQTSFQLALQNQYDTLRPSLPGAGEVIRSIFIDPSRADEVDKLLAKHGYTDKHIELLHIAQKATYPFPQALQLHMRGHIDEQTLDRRMGETGLTPVRIEELKHLAEHVPSIADIITFISREAFEEDQVALMGLDDDFPSALLEWGKKIGLEKDVAKLYWRSHWQQPGLGQIMEMLHRDEIDIEDLDHFYKVVEIPPYWRDRLTAIAYSPYTRVDARRMHDVGTLNDEQLLQSYKDIGYDAEKAAKMADFTVRYNRGEERTATKKLVEKSFAQGSITETEARGYLESVGIKKTEVDYIIAKVNYEREIDYIDREIDLTHTEYVQGFIERTAAQSRLSSTGIDVGRVTMYLREWDVEIRKKVRRPTKTDLDKFFHAGIIDIDNWIGTMSDIGYPIKYINWYMQLLLRKTAETWMWEEGAT